MEKINEYKIKSLIMLILFLVFYVCLFVYFERERDRESKPGRDRKRGIEKYQAGSMLSV